MTAPFARVVGCTALALVACAGQEPGAEGMERALASVLATCSSASGEVKVQRRSESAWNEVTIGTLFQPGDWVRTARTSRARVELRSGGALELEDDALVVIEAFDARPATAAGPVDEPLSGARAQALLDVQQGVVRGVFGERASALHVKTSDGRRVTLERHGAGDVEVRIARAAERTDLTVSKGEAAVAVGGGTAEVYSAGRGAQLAGGGLEPIEPLSSPAPAQPPPDARLPAADAASLTWAKVPGATGYRVQLANDAAFTQGVQTADVVEERFVLPVGEPRTAYYRVAALDAAGRQWDFGPSRRVFLESEPPRDLLLTPAEGAAFGHPGTPPRILFSWAPVNGARGYRLVVARGKALDDEQVVSEVTSGTQLVVDSLALGSYRWGVTVVDDGRPLFLQPRRLVVVKGAALRAPRIIRKWGDR